MASYSQTISVDVPSTQLWSLVCDVSRVAGLFPYTLVEDLSSPEPGCWLFWRQLTIPHVAELRWREQARIVSDGALHFQAVEGDLQDFTGWWRVAADGAHSTLTLDLEYTIPAAVAPNLPAMMVNYVMGEIFKSICQRVKEAAEEGAA